MFVGSDGGADCCKTDADQDSSFVPAKVFQDAADILDLLLQAGCAVTCSVSGEVEAKHRPSAGGECACQASYAVIVLASAVAVAQDEQSGASSSLQDAV